MNTTTYSRSKRGIVLFVLTLIGVVVIAAGLIWVTTENGAPDPVKEFNWAKNITENVYSPSYGQIEEHIRESQEEMQEQVRQSQERLDDFLKRN